MKKTKTLRAYLVKFAIRLMIFVGVFVLYLTNKPLMFDLMTQPVVMGITPLHGLWFVFMVMMVRHIFPTETLSMAFRKKEVRGSSGLFAAGAFGFCERSKCQRLDCDADLAYF